MRVITSVLVSSLSLALALVMAGFGAVVLVPSVIAAAPESASSFDELARQAEEHRVGGRYVESAQAFAAAYESLSERDQRGIKGEITIGNALDDYRHAQEKQPESLGLLFQEAALLERYGKRMGGLSEELGKELARVQARVVDLHRAEEERKAEERLAEEDRKAKERREAERRDAEEQELNGEPKPIDVAPQSRRLASYAILGAGLVSVAGGTALVASGAWNLGNVERRRDVLLAALEANGGGTPQMREGLRDEIEGWRNHWRGIGTGLAVSGGVLLAAGIGLTTWAAVRMRNDRPNPRRASVVWPRISAHELGIAFTGRY